MHLLKGHFPVRITLYSTLVALYLLLPSDAKAARATYSLATYRQWSKQPTDTLMTRGRAYLAHQTSMDSAFVCYTVVVERFKDGHGDHHERYQYAKALNNLGFMFATHYLDFEKAYNYLMESKRISQAEKFSDNLPYVYMNLAAMYDNRRSLFGISDPKHDALRSMRLAYTTAVHEQQWMVAYTCFTNLLSMVADTHSLESIRGEMHTFKSIYAKHPLPMGEYALYMMEWQEAYNRSDGQTALSCCRKLQKLVQKVPDIGLECELIAQVTIQR